MAGVWTKTAVVPLKLAENGHSNRARPARAGLFALARLLLSPGAV
jgi:hypothetical protein